jgi:hypothetical protein
VKNFLFVRDYNHLGLSNQNRVKDTVLGMNIAYFTGAGEKIDWENRQK